MDHLAWVTAGYPVASIVVTPIWAKLGHLRIRDDFHVLHRGVPARARALEDEPGHGCNDFFPAMHRERFCAGRDSLDEAHGL